MKRKELLEKIANLEKRILELESRPQVVYQPIWQYIPQPIYVQPIQIPYPYYYQQTYCGQNIATQNYQLTAGNY